jgi:hypothetical protein
MIDGDAVKLVTLHEKLKRAIALIDAECAKKKAPLVEQMALIERELDTVLMGMVTGGAVPKFAVEGVGVCRLAFSVKPVLRDRVVFKAHILEKGMDGFDYATIEPSKATIGEVERANKIIDVVPLVPGVDVRRSRKVRVTKR